MISWCGSWLGVVNLMVALFIMPSVVLILICVRGSVFGMLRTLRASFFLWSTTWGKILTIDNLNKRGLLLVNWFCMCWCNGETVDHLLINCEIAHTLWSIYDFWDPLGVARQGSIPSLWLAQLVWETFFECMEFGGCLCDLVSVEGMKQLHFWGDWETYWSIEVFAALYLVWLV